MKESHKNLLILVSILLFGFLIRTPFFSVPLERDEGMHATVGQVIVDGGAPYRDTVTFRAPGTYYTNALFIKIFGKSAEALRVGSAVYATLTTVVIFIFAKALYGERIGLLASFFYAAFSSGPMIQGCLSNAETFMMLPAVIATYLFYLGYKTQKNIFFLLAGILSGWAYLVKEASLPNFILFYLFLLFTSGNLLRYSTTKQVFVKYTLLSIGFAFSIAAMFTFLYAEGALNYYIIGAYKWNAGYGNYQLDYMWPRLRDRGIYTLGKEYSFLWIASFFSLIAVLFKNRRRDNALVLMWVLFSFMGVCLGTRFWPHYFIQMIPSLSIAAAYGVNKLYNGILSREFLLRTLSVIGIGISLFSFGYGIKNDYKFYLVYTPDEISRAIYGDDTFVNAKKVAAYIKERTSPSDYIYQNRWETEIYFLSQRRCPTRYIEHLSIYATEDVYKSVNELRSDILLKEPKFIIWYEPRPEEISNFIVKPIVEMKYELETTIGGVKVYRLKGWSGRKNTNGKT